MDKKKELQLEYEKIFGKKPHHKWGEYQLLEKIENFGKEDSELEFDKDMKSEDNDKFNGVSIDPRMVYTFKLLKKANPRTLLPRETKVWDENTNTVRTIRLSSTEQSPYLDEQDEKSLIDRTPICFTDGTLVISGTETNKIKFLLAHDGFSKKKTILPQHAYLKGMYELVDENAINEAFMTKEEIILEAKQVVKDSDKDDLAYFLASQFLYDVTSMTHTQLKNAGYVKAQENPVLFLKEFTNPKHKIKTNILKLFKSGLLTDFNGEVKWKDAEGALLHVDLSKGERAEDALTKWVLTGSKEAKDFEKLMETKLE